MTFEALQERLTALQDTAEQLRSQIDRLSRLYLQTADEDASIDGDGGVHEELSAEISQILREEEDELELLLEEVEGLPARRPGNDAEHHKARLRDTIGRLETEVKTYGHPPTCFISRIHG